MIGIYKITSPSGSVYIGQSWNILHRWADYGAKTAIKQRYLHHSFLKHGKKSHKFEVLHELPKDISQAVMDQYESLYIVLYSEASIKMMNLRGGGSRGKLSEETIRRMSEALKGRSAWNKGTKGLTTQSAYTKRLMSEIHSKGKYEVSIDGELVGEFLSERDAAKTIGVSFMTIRRLQQSGAIGQKGNCKGVNVKFHLNADC